jgi:class 3 adenylate cyclase
LIQDKAPFDPKIAIHCRTSEFFSRLLEDLREVIADYHGAVAVVVAKFSGFVAKYMGDGILVYFGYPQADEDDAERAVRAGLAVIEAVGRLPVRQDLRVRVGIATGLVVVGDLLGEGSAQERGVIGETPNLAARLQALAAPDTLVISEGVRRQVGRLFDLEDLGFRVLTGFVEEKRAWRVLSESAEESRFEALRSGTTTPLIGRTEEFELLCRRWQQAKTKEGRVVLISGEAGFGKSRLVAALLKHIEIAAHTRLRYFCSPNHQNSALSPFVAQLERAAGFVRDDAVDVRLEKLRSLVTPAADKDDVSLLSELLSLPSSAADLNLSPQRKRENLFEALLRQFEAAAYDRPVLAVFEDAHWIDPTSRELLDLSIDRVRRLPMLLVITHRPEFHPSWGSHPHVTTLSLNRLGERDAETLVHTLAGNAALPHDSVAEIVERTDGVPLFVEELTKAVMESAAQGNRVAAVLSSAPLAALSVPATLHASLMARLDRLGPLARDVAQTGAVLGREFTYELIEHVVQCDEENLLMGLSRLSDAGLLFCRGTPPRSSYLFKHALVQDTAYSTLLRGRRYELHARVAAVLERHFADIVERQPELLAHHLTACGATERAVDQWFYSGQSASARLNHLEATRYYDRGLALLVSLREDATRDRQEIDLQLARGLSLFTSEGFNSAAAVAGYTRARQLTERHGEANRRFMAVYGLWQGSAGAGRILLGRGLSHELLALTEDEREPGLRLQAHHTAWTTNLFAGELEPCRHHCEAGRKLYDPERHRSHRLLYGGHDPGVCACNMGAQAEWLLGHADTSLATSNDGLALAERIADPLSSQMALAYRAVLHLDRREPEPALQRIAAVEALAAEQKLGFVIDPRLMRGAALIALGATGEAITEIQQGLAGPFGIAPWRIHGRLHLARALADRGDRQGALATIRSVPEIVANTGHRQWEAEVYRTEGLVLLTDNDLDASQRAFEKALETARSQRARFYELRAATDLSRLWGEQGHRARARDLLEPIYDWFTEGFDTVDLEDAKNLINELA